MTTAVKGIVLLEGSFPVDHLHPGLKHLFHYGKQTGQAGILDWLSMFSFERKNKEVKKFARQTAAPESSLVNHVELDFRAKLDSFSKKIKIVPTRGYYLTYFNNKWFPKVISD